MKIENYEVKFKPEPSGGFTVLVPKLKGCVTYGRTRGEATAMARDAIAGYLASLRIDKQIRRLRSALASAKKLNRELRMVTELVA